MNTVRLFQDFQRIFGFCPCCGDPFRLSDAALFYSAAPPKTPFDDLEARSVRLADAEKRFQDEVDRLMEKGRNAGQKERERRLQVLTRFFRLRRLDLQDLKVLFHPVDYVEFRGYSEERCSEIRFIDREATSSAHERLQRSIERVLDAGDVSWHTAHVADDGQVSLS